MNRVDLSRAGREEVGETPATPDPDTLAVLEATRRLLWATTIDTILAACRELVQDLGGSLVDARAASSDTLPVDLALGAGPSLLPTARRGTAARAALERELPQFVLDAYRAIERLERSERFADEASQDPLTGLSNRRAVARLLPRVRNGSVVLVDLDHFKLVNDSQGHDAGDHVLREFASALTRTARASDHVARMGGEEFLVVLDTRDPAPFVERLRQSWRAARSIPVTFSAGTAQVRGRAEDALVAADRALYRAKESGRDRWCAASDDEHVVRGGAGVSPGPARAGVVAPSSTPSGGGTDSDRGQLEATHD